MSRSGYSYDFENLELYRASVERAIKGQRGQAFLRELATAMDAMPVKALIVGELVARDGACCTIGVVCKARGLDVSDIDYYEPDSVAKAIGVARSMAAEIEYMNDELVAPEDETPAERWARMRKWVKDHIAKEPNQ